MVSASLLHLSSSNGITGRSSSGCGGGGCHGTAANTSTSLTIALDDTTSRTTYTPGRSYRVKVTIANSAMAKIGFNAFFDKGTVLAVDGTTSKYLTSEIKHTAPKAMSGGSGFFEFDWTAPTVGSGNVILNVAGNAVNGTGGDDGDMWNTKSLTLTEQMTSSSPVITNVTKSNISMVGATISAKVTANSTSNISVSVDYGTTTSYGSNKATTPSIVTGTSATSVSATLTGLSSNTKYYYRVKAGSTTSARDSFTTTTLGILSASPSIDLKFYPNPSQDYIQLISPAQNIKSIALYAMNGQKKNIEFVSNSEGYRMDIKTVSNGLYYIILEDKTGNKANVHQILEVQR